MNYFLEQFNGDVKKNITRATSNRETYRKNVAFNWPFYLLYFQFLAVHCRFSHAQSKKYEKHKLIKYFIILSTFFEHR